MNRKLVLAILYAILLITPVLSWKFVENPLLISNLKETFLLSSIVILAALYLLSPSQSLKGISIPLKYPLICLVSASVISILRSESPVASIRGFYYVLLLAMFYGIVSVSIKNKAERTRLIVSTIIISSFISVYFLMQYFNIDPLGLREDYPSATFTNQNFLAGFFIIVLPLSIAFTFMSHQKLHRTIFFLFTVLIFIAILFTKTRGAWVSVALGTAFFFYIARHDIKIRKKGMVLALLLFAIFTIAIVRLGEVGKSSFAGRFKSIFNPEESSNKHRILMWRSSLDMIKDSPWIGIGVGTFEMNYPRYQGKYLRLKEYSNYTGSTIHAHNEYVETAAETGILGIGSLIWFIIAIFKYGSDLLKNREREERLLVVALLSGIATTLFYGLFSFPFHMPTSSMLFWFFIGILGSMVPQSAITHYLKRDVIARTPTLRRRTWQSNLVFRNFNNSVVADLGRLNLWTIRIGVVIITIFILAWTIRPFWANIHFYKGYQSGKAGNMDAAMTSFQKSIRINPYDYKSHYNLAILYEDRNMPLPAIDEYEKVLELYPVHVETHIRLGNLYTVVGDLENALKEYKKAEEIFPTWQK